MNSTSGFDLAYWVGIAVAIVGGFVTIIGSVLTVATYLKQRHLISAQTTHEDASAAKDYAEAAKIAAENLEKAEARMLQYEATIRDLKRIAETARKQEAEIKRLSLAVEKFQGEIAMRDQMIDHLSSVVAQKTQDIDNLKIWAAALVAQVRESKTEPITFEAALFRKKVGK